MKKLVGITALSMLLTLIAHAADMVCLEDVGGFDTLLVEKFLGPQGQVQDVVLLAFFESAQACQEKALTGKRPSNVITYNRSELSWIRQQCYFEMDTTTLKLTNNVYRLNHYILNSDEEFSAPLRSVKLKQIHTGDFFFEGQQDCVANMGIDE